MKTRIGSVIALVLAFNVLSLAWQNVASTGRSDIPAPPQPPRSALRVANCMSGMTSGELAAVPDVIAGFEGEDQDDPSYTLYKAGYKLVLDEKWAEARKKFSEVLSKYPRSKYSAEALYWTAYSWKYSDKKKAIETYKSFMKQYPTSNYYDDASGDLGRLENPVVPRPDRFAPPQAGYAVTAPELARAAATISEAASTYGVVHDAHIYPEGKADDPEVRMKVEAFQALIRSNKDEKTFELVRETLLDPKQPYRLRETALYALRQFEKKDLSDLYLQVMKSDTSKLLTQNIIYQLGFYAERGDEKIIDVLKQTALDSNQDRRLREASLQALCAAKRPDLLNFYAEVARNDVDLHVRQSALYQIAQSGSANEDTAYKLLSEFALDKSQGREFREAALSSLGSMRGNKPAELYLQVARTDPDERIQEMALYLFVGSGKSQPEKVSSTLKEIVQDRNRSWSMREAAMNNLVRIDGDEALKLLVMVAKTDPEERIRLSAINFIGYLGRTKAKSLLTLISLFETLPKNQMNSVQSLMYAIASIGNDEAVDFLGRLAKTHENHEVRRIAIQYLGNIGGEKARTVLVDILKGR